MTVRDVKPFVGSLVVPYFMDIKLIASWMEEIGCDRAEAIELLTKKWMKEKDRGH